jgi:hypothetical protein
MNNPAGLPINQTNSGIVSHQFARLVQDTASSTLRLNLFVAIRAINALIRDSRLRVAEPMSSEAGITDDLDASRTVVRETLRALAVEAEAIRFTRGCAAHHGINVRDQHCRMDVSQPVRRAVGADVPVDQPRITNSARTGVASEL